MNISDPHSKDQMKNRLKRIEGQVRGVQSMLDEERDCREILQQLAAIRAAVHSATQQFVEEYASKCLLSPLADDPAERQKMLQDLLLVLSKAP